MDTTANIDIVISLGPVVRIDLPTAERYAALTRSCRTVEPLDLLLFYEWIENDHHSICAIELFSDRDDPINRVLRDLPYVDFVPYPWIWLTSERSGKERGVQAFGDIDMLIDQHGGWHIHVTSGSLTEQDIPVLRSLAT